MSYDPYGSPVYAYPQAYPAAQRRSQGVPPRRQDGPSPNQVFHEKLAILCNEKHGGSSTLVSNPPKLVPLMVNLKPVDGESLMLIRKAIQDQQVLTHYQNLVQRLTKQHEDANTEKEYGLNILAQKRAVADFRAATELKDSPNIAT